MKALFSKANSYIISITLAVLIIATFINLSIFSYIIESDHDQRVKYLHTKAIPKINNQTNIIENRLSTIKDYTNILSNTTDNLERYDEKKVSNILKNYFLTKLGVFQLRLLSEAGKELIRYDLDDKNHIVKSSNLQDKSNRYYYQESKDIHVDDIYFSKFDLNVEHGKIEIPYKNTTRVVKKVKIGNDMFFIIINYNLSDIFNQTLESSIFETFLIEKDDQINFHINNDYSFSKQKNNNIYLKDVLKVDKRQYITQENLKHLNYTVVIAISNAEMKSLNSIKNDKLTNAKLISIVISLLIALIFLIVSIFINIKNKKNKQITQILNAQTSFTLLTDGKDLKQANKSTLDFFGYRSLEDFHKEHDCICEFFLNEDGYLQSEQDRKTWLEVLLEDTKTTHEVKIKDLDGGDHIFQINTSGKQIEEEIEASNLMLEAELSSEEGSTYVVTLTDITELERLKYNLHEQVQEQVAQLKQQQQTLTEQSRLAAMGEMLANISHQWKQPLSTLSYMIQTLQFQPIESKEKSDELVEKALPQINYLSNTIEDFRTFFIEDKDNHNFKIDDAIKSALHIVGKTLENKQIDVQIEANSEFELYGKQNTFAQVIINILNNAKDILVQNNIANPKVVIEYGIKDNINYITIKDNAGGIPDDVLPKIFEPYFTTKFQDQGTGIGLYMSKMIIENQMGGNLNASNIDNGALFTINFKNY